MKVKCHSSKGIWFNSLCSRQFSERSKLNDKNKSIFVGYRDESKGNILILWIMNWFLIVMLYLMNCDAWNWEIAAKSYLLVLAAYSKAITLVPHHRRRGRKWVLPIFINHVSFFIFYRTVLLWRSCCGRGVKNHNERRDECH